MTAEQAKQSTTRQAGQTELHCGRFYPNECLVLHSHFSGVPLSSYHINLIHSVLNYPRSEFPQVL